MSRTLFLIRGLPGSGKSTLARYIVRRALGSENLNIRATHIEADDYFNLLGCGEYKFNGRLVGAAHDWCYGNTIAYLARGYDIVAVANTFSTRRELLRYINGVKRAKMDDVNVVVVKCVGDYGSEHDVPARTIERMKARWEDFPGEVIFTGDEL